MSGSMIDYLSIKEEKSGSAGKGAPTVSVGRLSHEVYTEWRMKRVKDMYASVHVSLLLLRTLFLATGATATCDIAAFNDSVQLIVDCGGNEHNITVSTVPPLSSGNNNSLCFNQNGTIVTGSALLDDLAFSRDAENECTITECNQVVQPQSHFVFVNSSCFQDIDECSISDSCNATTEDCSNTIGGFNCSCKTGFSRNDNNICEDVDECSNNICSGIKNSQCNNTLGGYKCCRENQALWTYPSFPSFCADFVTNYAFILDCTLPEPTYAVDEVEPITMGQRVYDIGYECRSASGNQVKTYTNQESFIEYQSGNPIRFPITGIDQFGNGTQCTVFGFVFLVDDGFVGVGIANSTCYLDRNECDDGSNNCSGDNEMCRNTVGSYDCDCVIGYKWADNGTYCEDINECTSETSGCSQNCDNSPGSYQCSCTSGFELAANNRSCNDIDECNAVTSGCIHNCTNLHGSFQCNCTIGYELASDGKGCNDIDECANGQSGCRQNCTNFPGSYQCSCRSGYQLAADLSTCNDIDECRNATLVLECVENSTCVDTDGSFVCNCDDDFEGDGRIECRRRKDHTVLLVSSILPSLLLILIVIILMIICTSTVYQHFKQRKIYNFSVHKYYYYVFGKDSLWSDLHHKNTELELVDVKPTMHFYPKSPSILTDIDELCYDEELLLTDPTLDNDTKTASVMETVENATVKRVGKGSNGTDQTLSPVTVKGKTLSIASNDYVSVTLPTSPGSMCNRGSAGTTSAGPCNVLLGPTTNEGCNGYVQNNTVELSQHANIAIPVPNSHANNGQGIANGSQYVTHMFQAFAKSSTPAPAVTNSGYVESNEFRPTTEKSGQDTPTDVHYVAHEPVACANTCRPVPQLAAGGYVESEQITNIPPEDSLAFDLEPSDTSATTMAERDPCRHVIERTAELHTMTTAGYGYVMHAAILTPEEPSLSNPTVAGYGGANNNVEDTTLPVPSPTSELATDQLFSAALSPSAGTTSGYVSLGDPTVAGNKGGNNDVKNTTYLLHSPTSELATDQLFSAALSPHAGTALGYISLGDPTVAGNGGGNGDVKDTTHLLHSPTSELATDQLFSAALSRSEGTTLGYISLGDPTVAGNGGGNNDVKDTTHLLHSPTIELATDQLFPAALSRSEGTTSGYISLSDQTVAGNVGGNNDVKDTTHQLHSPTSELATDQVFSAVLSPSAGTTSGYISLGDPTVAGNGRGNNYVKDTTHLFPSPTSELPTNELFSTAFSPSASTTSGYVSLGSVAVVENQTKMIGAGHSSRPTINASLRSNPSNVSHTKGGGYIPAPEMDVCTTRDHETTHNVKTTGYVACDIATASSKPCLTDQGVTEAHIPVPTELTPTILSPLSVSSYGRSPLPGNLLSPMQPRGQHYMAGSESSGYFSELSTSSYSDTYHATFDQTTSSDRTSDPIASDLGANGASAAHNEHNVRQSPSFNDHN